MPPSKALILGLKFDASVWKNSKILVDNKQVAEMKGILFIDFVNTPNDIYIFSLENSNTGVWNSPHITVATPYDASVSFTIKQDGMTNF